MWNQKMKAVTFSYDDGIEQDIRLIELLDRYGLRGTFNLNLGLQDRRITFRKSDLIVRHLDKADIPKVYANHEIAGHTTTHPRLTELDSAAIREEIFACHDGLQQLTGRAVTGMAYPYGDYDDRVVDIARKLGVQYARTTTQCECFELPADPLRLTTTCRHANPKALDLARAFVESDPNRPQLFYLWGHSYEFDEFGTWDMIEEFCKTVSNRTDIFYGTNSEVLAPFISKSNPAG